MKKLFGNGRPLAIAVFAIGVVAIAIPAFGASSGGSSGSSTQGSGSSPNGALPLPPPMAFSGKSKKELEQTAQCMKDHGIAPPPDLSQGSSSTAPKPPSSSEFQAAAKACGLPKPPGGAMLAPPMGAPGIAGKLDPGAVQRCLHAQAEKH